MGAFDNDRNNNAKDNSNLNYDDAAFQSFLLTLLALYCLPVLIFRSVKLLRRLTHVPTPVQRARTQLCVCSLCQRNRSRLEPRRSRISLHDLFLFACTLLLVYTAVNVYRANRHVEPPFDPFQILGVQHATPLRQIKRAYRRLSVLHHPDKNRNDPHAAERFIKITKAYAALTDPVAKENFQKYGNPDGRLTTIIEIGLPQWIAHSRHFILLSYLIALLFVFPLVVGTWWRRRCKQFTPHILTETINLYAQTLQLTSRFRDLLGAFCGSLEFAHMYNSQNDTAIKELTDTLKRAGCTDMRKTKTVVQPTPAHYQNLIVMTAYLARLPIPAALHTVRDTMLQRVEPLTTALTDTVGAFPRPDCQAAWNKHHMRGNTLFMSNAITLTQSLIQALDEKSSPFLQIPHFTDKEVRYCLSSRTPHIKTIYDFMKLDMAEQRSLLRAFSDDEFLDVKAFCDRFPSANLDVTEPVVEGEEDGTVHAGDTVTIRAQLTVMRRSGSVFSPHTPNLTARKEEAWWLWLADERLQCPIDVKRLTPQMAVGYAPKRRHKHGADEHGAEEHNDKRAEKRQLVEQLLQDPRVTRFHVKFRFAAPRAGQYSLEVKAVCDCYSGATKSKLVKMKVEKEVEPPSVDSVKYFDTDDESSEEEDEEDEEDEEGGGDSSDEGEQDSDDDYEYIEVTDDEASEAGDFDDDEHGVSTAPHGDATAHS
ncbi:unnamed protein product [Agarophyton chilense]